MWIVVSMKHVKRKIKKKRLFLIGGIALVFVAMLCFLYAVYTGRVQLNRPSADNYPIRGVDVSSYQGTVDWAVMAAQDIDFAFLKATEGSGLTDPTFAANFKNAVNSGLRVGAYHFFSYDSPGETQADNFIAAVPKTEGMLPPVVDLEFYGDYNHDPMDAEQCHAILIPLLEKLEAHYGVKPILYVTENSYDLYVRGALEDYDVWARSIFGKPSFLRHRDWTFWQYTNRAHLDGYDGEEYYIDMNVFNGDEDAFRKYANSD